MGYDYRGDGWLRIELDRQDQAAEALRAAIPDCLPTLPGFKNLGLLEILHRVFNGGTNRFSQSAAEVRFNHSGNKTDSKDRGLEVLAPFVAAGGIAWRGEDDLRWDTVFRDGQLHFVYYREVPEDEELATWWLGDPR